MRSNKTSVGWAKKAAGAREEALSPKVGPPWNFPFPDVSLQKQTEYRVTFTTFKSVVAVLAALAVVAGA